MKRQPGLVFDLDGTLYSLRGGDGTFGESDFYADLKGKMYSFLADVLGISIKVAKAEYDTIKNKFGGEVSIGVEQELGINRFDWFENTWNLDPAQYIDKPTEELAETIRPVSDRSMVLTAAPAVWAYPSLCYLGLGGMFGDRIVTGESDIRKPDPKIFRMAADTLSRECHEIVSIGDQTKSDILPAKALGMLTIKIGHADNVADYTAKDVVEAVAIASDLQSGRIGSI